MSLVDVITRFSTAAADGTPGGYIVTRTAQSAYGSDGIAAGGGPVEAFAIDACVQPYSGRGLTALPEGIMASDIRVIDTATELLVVSADFQPDSIVIAGDKYIVFKVDGPFYMSGVAMFAAYAARVVVP